MKDENQHQYQEWADGPTPNGGSYSILYWKGPDGGRATRETAVGGEIVEFDESGKEVFRTYFENAKPSKKIH